MAEWRTRWIFRIYNLAILIALPLIVLWVIVRWRTRVVSKGFKRWPERWGKFSDRQRASLPGDRPWWWVHAVSMGEAKAIEPFLRRAPRHAPVRILLTVVTPEALEWAEKQPGLADLVMAAPIDLPWVVRRVFTAVRPHLFISVESEFWPNLLRQAKRAGAKVALINGRISQRSFESYRSFGPMTQVIWDCFDLMAVRQSQDAERFAALGMRKDRIHITGNLKFDLAATSARTRAEDASPTVVLGSTREGEEAQLLPVFERLRQQWPALKVIWAPRHLDRVSEIESVFRQQGVGVKRKSSLGFNGHGLPKEATHVLWDSMGDLLEAYRQADVAVIGGSFVPKGGQNPIEPAALSVPVIFGPSMDNFYGIAEALVAEGGARQVSRDELEPCLQALLANPAERRAMGERARQSVENQQGATERTLGLLETLTRD